MKTLVILIFSFLLFACSEEVTKSMDEDQATETNKVKTDEFIITSIDAAQIPNSIKYEGKIKNAFKYKDKSGENIVFICETGITRSKKFEHEFDEGGDAELFAYHYKITDGTPELSWKVYDFISDCPVDIVASFVKNTFQITDLDKNGIAEIWLMYKTVCHGDVSPCDMKIIMYEDKQKFAMRGVNKIVMGTDDNGENVYFGGEYKIDNAFEKGNILFKNFAISLWNQNIIENWDN